MAQQWYYAQGGRKVGPITSQELRALAASGALRPTDLVWIDGHDRGREARLVKGLFTPVEVGASAPIGGRTGGTPRTDGGVDPTLDLDRLRGRLTRHANAVPHHGVADLGLAVEIRGGRRIPIYHISWTSLFECRRIVERQAPHDGTRVFPPPKYRRQNLDAWTLALPSPTDFADGSSELPVEGSETVHGCGQCQSVGHVTCDGCQGQRTVTCGQCGGGGLVRCGACSGAGRTYQVRSEQRTRVCGNAGVLPKFHGTGYSCHGGRDQSGNVCRRCNGTGVEYYIHQERHPVPCVTCTGQGRHACPACGGGRMVACPRCGGQGQITCPACQGHRRVVQYLSVVQSHEANEEVAITPADKCPEEAVQGLGPAEFRETLARSSFGSPPDVTLDPKLHVLVGPIRALRNKVRAQGGADRRRVGDRLRITEAQVVRLDYAFEGREYTAWFSGEDGSVHAPDSPITEAAARHIEDALAAWKEGRRKDAIRSLRPAVAMAKKSQECRAVLEIGSPRIPEELIRRASAFSIPYWFGNIVDGVRQGLAEFRHGVQRSPQPDRQADQMTCPGNDFTNSSIIQLDGREGVSNDLPPLPADEGSEPVAGRVKPTASSVDAEVGGVEPEENVGFPWLLVVSLALTLVGMWKMSSEGWSLGDFLGIVFFGFCSFVYALVYFGLRKGRIPGTSEAFLPSVEGVPDGRESQKNVEPPEASSWDGLSAWVERFRIKDVGYSAVALPSLGLFLLVAFRDTQPFLSALFWYWGICCLALPGVVHERPSANFFEWAGSCLLRTIIFFVAGVLGSVIFSLFWGGVMKGSIDDAFPVGFVLATLPTLLIPNRFDILLPAALAALFTARGMTTSRSAGLCPRCQGTGYCYVCRGRGAHGGAQCAACLATGMCGECSGTGGRSVL